ncbi:MAG: GFA family protein [Geminicoccaceae bacterium]
MSVAGERTLTGRCACGAVAFALRPPLRPVIFCHCGQCRRHGTHFAAFSSVPADALSWQDTRGLRWYRSSSFAERGFCAECGCALFYRQLDSSDISVSAGCLEPQDVLRAQSHIFLVDKPAWYAVDDGLPGFEVDDPEDV